MRRKLGGGYEEVVVKLEIPFYNVARRYGYYYFKLIKIDRRVDVYQVHEKSDALNTLPSNFKASEQTCLSAIYASESDPKNKRYFEIQDHSYGLLVDETLSFTNEYSMSMFGDTHFQVVLMSQNQDINQVYIGSYITKE